jgi:CheY-like chemotaxis protein
MQSLSVLAGGVAHDLNNVLGPLVALPDVILSELDSWDLPARTVVDVRADIECIKGASLRAAQTIKDLLTLGRQGQVAKSVLDLNTLVRDCLSDGTFRLLQEQRDRVTVKLNLSHEPANIRGSDPHIARALTNLIKNAVEAMSGQGEVTVSVHATELLDALVGYETIEPGNYVVLSVADTGRGIAQADLSRLFEPFFSNKRHTESSGTGLGLAIVHGVVKEHDGFVDVVSTECSGTTFRLYFPRWLEKAATIKPAQEAPVVRARVMVVDDSQVQLRTARRILSHLGYEVETIESGAQAHRIFADAAGSGQTPYDLVLLDMNLNEQRDGLELFGVLRGWFPSLRAILVSGHAPNERVAKAVQQGVAWLAKPYTADELGSAVRRAMVGKDDRLHPSSHSPRRHSSGALRALRTPRRLPKR